MEFKIIKYQKKKKEKKKFHNAPSSETKEGKRACGFKWLKEKNQNLELTNIKGGDDWSFLRERAGLFLLEKSEEIQGKKVKSK